MLKCIFCSNELPAKNKPEHILLDALGGRKTTTRVDCTACNCKFGATMDKILANQVLQIRNLMQFRSGSGDTAPGLRGVQAGDEKINVKGDGEIKIVQPPFIITEVADGKWNLQITVSTLEEVEKYIPHIAAKMKMPEDRLREQVAAATASRVSKRPGVVSFSPQFGGLDAIRSMVKSSLVLWALEVGNEEVRCSAYEASRSFVMDGCEDFLKNKTRMDSRQNPLEAELKSRFGPLYNLLYIKSDPIGKVIGYFTLYNINSWQFVLAEAGGTPDKCIALASDPEHPEIWSDTVATDLDISSSWLDTPEYSTDFVAQKARFDALMQHYFKVNLPRVNSDIIEQSLRQMGIKEGDKIPTEIAHKLSKIIAERAVHHMTDSPYEEPISAEELTRLLGKRNP